MSESSLLQTPSLRAAPAARARTASAGAEPDAPASRDPIRAAVLGLDRWLGRQSGIQAFTDNPGCILRVARTRADAEMRLSDAVVRRGDPILELHFWNERLPQASATQGLGWGGQFGRALRRSFGELAAVIDRDPRLSDAVALRGRLAFAAARDRDDTRRFGHWFALETPAEPPGPSLCRRVFEVGEDIWALALAYTFNPGCLQGRQIARRRDELWMSKATLLARYGGARRTAR